MEELDRKQRAQQVKILSAEEADADWDNQEYERIENKKQLKVVRRGSRAEKWERMDDDDSAPEPYEGRIELNQRPQMNIGLCFGCGQPCLTGSHCVACLKKKANDVKRKQDTSDLLTQGLADTPTTPSNHTTTSAISEEPQQRARPQRRLLPLFMLCTIYLSNNTKCIHRSVFSVLPPMTRSVLFYLELYKKHSRLSILKELVTAQELQSAEHGLDLRVSFAPNHLSVPLLEDFFSLKLDSVSFLTVLLVSGLSCITNDSLAIIARYSKLKVLDISNCEEVTSDGIYHILPSLDTTVHRDSWEDLADDETTFVPAGDSSASLIKGLGELEVLGVYGCPLVQMDVLLAMTERCHCNVTVYTSLVSDIKVLLPGENRPGVCVECLPLPFDLDSYPTYYHLLYRFDGWDLSVLEEQARLLYRPSIPTRRALPTAESRKRREVELDAIARRF